MDELANNPSGRGGWHAVNVYSAASNSTRHDLSGFVQETCKRNGAFCCSLIDSGWLDEGGRWMMCEVRHI